LAQVTFGSSCSFKNARGSLPAEGCLKPSVFLPWRPPFSDAAGYQLRFLFPSFDTAGSKLCSTLRCDSTAKCSQRHRSALQPQNSTNCQCQATTHGHRRLTGNVPQSPPPRCPVWYVISHAYLVLHLKVTEGAKNLCASLRSLPGWRPGVTFIMIYVLVPCPCCNACGDHHRYKVCNVCST